MNEAHAIHITGMVQGVGFRPWVWKTAVRLGLKGTVRNGFDGVWIELFGDPSGFLGALKREPPPLAEIDSVRVTAIPPRDMDGFTILESGDGGEALLRISPDVALCEACRRELFDPADRRHRYPFINCVDCGPRFSIIERLPYDRASTSMRRFDLCPECRAEYQDPSGRRYHAQPVACPTCGPRILADDWESLWQISMEEGRIVAVKGIGGFHLACAALNPGAVAALRSRKGRESKPFALMVPDLEWVRRICHLSLHEEHLLTAAERPIVVLRMRARFETAELLAPGLDTLGVMLPYSPMHEIMFDRFPHPVVMTSANYSSEPMIHANDEALRRLEQIADLFLLHDREIVNRCDDPVCVVHGDRAVLLRPGRGTAPLAMPLETQGCILACGADLKNTFALAHHGSLVLHPYIGDLEHPETQAILEVAIARQLECFRQQPALIVHDLHPDYHSGRIAETLAQRYGSRLLAVQHHHAHLAGAHPGRAIGFAFDGTGYGADGTIWGGEVLLYDVHGFTREFHLRPFALPGGDAAVMQPRRVLTSLLYQTDPTLQSDPSVVRIMESGINCPMTSSMGRLFDAVSCLLGICENPTYDGEAAMRLEAAADPDECGDLEFHLTEGEIDWRPLIRDLLDEQQRGVAAPALAARFHNTLAEIVYCCGRKLAEGAGTGLPWVFAGGVFQNRLLVERIKRVAGGEFNLVFSACPNDSGIAIGQAVIGAGQWGSK